jgi:hypothetical protein
MTQPVFYLGEPSFYVTIKYIQLKDGGCEQESSVSILEVRSND